MTKESPARTADATGASHAFAAAIGPRAPYDPRALAAEIVTLECFDVPPKSYRVGEYASCFDNISHRSERWALSALTEMKARHDLAQAEAVGFINSGGDRDTIARIFDAWAERHAAASIEAIRAHSSMASPIVTGPANFPVQRMENMNRASRIEAMRIEAMARGVVKRMKRAAFPYGAPGEAIRSNNPDAVALLNEKIKEMEAQREAYKHLNAAWRKAGRPGVGDDAGWARFADIASMRGVKASHVDAIRRSCESHYMAKRRAVPPIESLTLTNLNARIKQARGRLAAVEALPPADAPRERLVETEAGAVQRVENGEAARIQLIFPGKPDAAVRGVLKANGFRWAPTLGAWQRHLNANGRDAADRVLALIAAPRTDRAGEQ